MVYEFYSSMGGSARVDIGKTDDGKWLVDSDLSEIVKDVKEFKTEKQAVVGYQVADQMVGFVILDAGTGKHAVLDCPAIYDVLSESVPHFPGGAYTRTHAVGGAIDPEAAGVGVREKKLPAFHCCAQITFRRVKPETGFSVDRHPDPGYRHDELALARPVALEFPRAEHRCIIGCHGTQTQ